MSAPRSPFPFVVGCERSGTTLLRLMLDAHPDLTVPPESYFIVDLHRRGGHYRRGDGSFDATAFGRDLAGSRWFRRWGIPPGTLEAALEGGDGLDFSEAVRRVYRTYARLQGKPRYGDKTPAHVQQLPLLASLFPEARFVHLIRDGRDVAAALADVTWGPRDVVDGAIHWAERVRRGRGAGGDLGADRYLEVRYESLVAEPASVLGKIAAFLDLPYHRAMVGHDALARGRAPQADVHRRASEGPRTGVRDWRRDVDPADLAAVEAAVGDLLEDLGYERAVPDPPPQAHHRALAAARRRSRRHLLHRLKARARRLAGRR